MMKFKLILPMVTLSLSACGTRELRPEIEIPQELRDQWGEFVGNCHRWDARCDLTSDLTVTFREDLATSAQAWGICGIQWDGPTLKRRIQLQAGLTEMQTKWVFEHELQHCVRFQRHVSPDLTGALMHTHAQENPTLEQFNVARVFAFWRDERMEGF